MATYTIGSADITHGTTMSKSWVAGIICAMLANLGFSTRQCLVKSLYVHEGRGALEAFGKVGLAGTVWGVFLFLWFTVFSVSSGAIRQSDTLSIFHIEFIGEWVIVSVCYFLYQASSLLILECIAVESHALLVGMKHVFSVITVSLLLGANLTPTILIGLFVSAVGIVVYSLRSSDETQKAGNVADADPETALIMPKLGMENHGIPPVLYCISGILVLLGCMTPMV